MSGFVRSLEKRIMKRAGYTREKWVIEKNVRGEPQIRNVKRRGEITDPDDNPIGRLWPALIPSRAKVPHKAERANRHRVVPRALRRSKRSQQWLAKRAAAIALAEQEQGQ